MKHYFYFISLLLLGYACTPAPVEVQNPLLVEYTTPYQVPPFEQIQYTHYLPAFDSAMKLHNIEIDAIVNQSADPTFANTIEAYEYSGSLLTRVGDVFYNQLSANTSDSLQAVARELAPKMSAHGDNIKLNAALFARIKSVYDQKDELSLTDEQMRLLTETYKRFVRGGANLPADKKEKFKEINQQLSVLSLQFGDNVLAETNEFTMLLDDVSQLDGLPESVIAAAAETAKEKGNEGKWMFTIHKPSLIPFLQYASNRGLREKMFRAYMMQGDNNNGHDNKDIIKQLVLLRQQRANLLGYSTHAHFILDNNMAGTPDKVYDRLQQLWEPALKMSKQEVVDMQKLIDAEGGNFQLAPWDWWYYAEKVRKERFDLDEETLRPYFQLENVRNGMFELVKRLFGIEFKPIDNISLPHPDATAFEVVEEDGTHIGVLFMDFHPRASKSGGAWMSSYRKQSKKDGQKIDPVITMVMNFSKATGDKPALLSFEEVETMFHEFGHALHGLLSNCTYPSLSGTAVSRDFVELPSQIMENWAGEPEMLKLYAKHFQTGEVIPDELIEKMQNSKYFNQGFATVEYLAASFLDMDWYTLTNAKVDDVNAFEKASMDKIQLIDEIIPRYRSTYFRHIFSGGYSSGYYSYVWAEMLDADAFAAFKETGDIFDKATASAFRSNVLARGGTDEPMKLYLAFRGKEPQMEALLKRKGFLK